MRRPGIYFAAVLTFGLTGSAAAEQLLPRDDARQDPSFFSFRRQLIAAVRKRDRKFILKIVDPKIRINFGEGGGADEFARQWKLRSDNSPLWKILAEVLSLGGTFTGRGSERMFAAPYTYAAFPESLDAFEYYCVTSKNVPLRAKPDERARIIAGLSYDLVRQAPLPRGAKTPGPEWVHVSTSGGKRGFVARRFVRSPVDYRALFQKRNGAWRMTALIAGD